MHRFFVLPKQIESGKIWIEGSDAHHISTVLRLGVGDRITVCDGAGTDYDCVLESPASGSTRSRDPIWVSIVSSQPCLAEPGLNVSLFQGVPKSGKMELIIQKTVELGVFEIIPVFTENTVVKRKPASQKEDRWQKIAEAAAKQCGRGIIPQVRSPLTLEEAAEQAQTLDFSLVAYEFERQRTLKEALQLKSSLPPDESKRDFAKKSDSSSMGLFIGPEGGFSPEEIQLLARRDILPFTLGRRILRTETAGFTALLLSLYERGEFSYE